MAASRTYLSHIPRAVKSNIYQAPLAYPALRLVACRRCGGLLADEHCMEVEIGPIEKGYWARRCIQCGDMIDETILLNRCAPPQTLQEIGPVASPLHDRKEGRDATISLASPTVRRPPPLRTADPIR